MKVIASSFTQLFAVMITIIMLITQLSGANNHISNIEYYDEPNSTINWDSVTVGESRCEVKTRSGQDTDGDEFEDTEDILDEGNAVIILSIDYLDMDYNSDFWTDGDPQTVFWIDGENDGEFDEEDGELWWAPLFNDTDVISDEGFENKGVLWHGFDIPDDMDLVFIEIWVFDDDYTALKEKTWERNIAIVEEGGK